MVSVPPTSGLRDRWSSLFATAAGIRTLVIVTGAVGLLLAAGAAAIVWNSAEGHRRTAEELLQGQADFLASNFASSVQIQSWLAVRTQLHAWREVARPGGPLPRAREVEEGVTAGTVGR